MGTSSSFGGQSGGTPLIPSWLDADISIPNPLDGDSGIDPNSQFVPGEAIIPPSPVQPQADEPIPAMADTSRFTTARNNFSRFAGSGGDDRRSLGRAVTHYVGSSLGGSRTAAARLGSARGAGSRLLGFLSDAVNRGAEAALQALNLDSLAGLPIQDIFLGLSDYVCPDGGSLDEGIAREAFIETIADLAGAGITDLDGLTVEQMQTVFELFATNAIEARLCNDIGTKTITLPQDKWEVGCIQAQLNDFIRRGVSDALAENQVTPTSLTPDRVLLFVDSIYEQAYEILLNLGEVEAEGT